MTNGEKIKEIFPDAEFDNAKPFTDGRWETMNLDTENSNRAQYKPTQLRVYADWWNAEYKEPITKNDLPHCQHSDEEIAKSFIEDVEAVKDQLPCFCEQMDFPSTFDEFADYYGFKDTKEVYTNGSELIQVFRVKQWLEHISTTNNLGVDYISRQAVIDLMMQKWGENFSGDDVMQESIDAIRELPSVTPQEPRKGHWIADVDRWGDLVTTVNGYRCDKCNTFNADKDNYCPNCGADMREVKE